MEEKLRRQDSMLDRVERGGRREAGERPLAGKRLPARERASASTRANSFVLVGDCVERTSSDAKVPEGTVRCSE